MARPCRFCGVRVSGVSGAKNRFATCRKCLENVKIVKINERFSAESKREVKIY